MRVALLVNRDAKVLRKSSVRVIGTTCLLSVALASAALVFEGENYSPPPFGRLLAAALTVLLLALSVRAMRLGVVVSPSRLSVRNLLRTVDVDRTQVLSVALPNGSAIQAIPALRMESGKSVGLIALSRTKNRAWGTDRTTERLVQELAHALGVPVEGAHSDREFGWG